MANKPYMCGGSDITMPDCSDCDELRSRLDALEQEVEECCQEVRETLATHTEQIEDIYAQLELLRTQIESMTGLRTEVVDELPEVGEPNVIYLTEEQGGTYSMWLYSDDEWLQVGGGNIDLSNYVTTTDLQTALANYVTNSALTTALAGKQDTLTASTGIRINNNAIQRVPLVGEIVPTGSSSAPGYYGGYTLVDKDFKAASYVNENVSWSGITSNRSSMIRLKDKQISIKIYFDATITAERRICKVSLGTLGLSDVPYQYATGYNDDTGQIGMFKGYNDGGYLAIDCVDAVPHSSNGNGTWYLQFYVEFRYAQMENSACDKFYWKRTS